MAADNTNSNLQFADVQAAITQVVNDNTAQNNAIASQIKEVQQLITDFGVASQQGSAPSQAQLQQAVAQLQAIHSLVQQNTASVQASAAAVSTADPQTVSGQQPAPAPTQTGTGAPNTGLSPSQAPASEGSTTGSTTAIGASGAGVTNETPTGASNTGENTSSSLG